MEVDDFPVAFRCDGCRRSLGKRLYSTPIYSEREGIERGLSASTVVSLFLDDPHGNGTVEVHYEPTPNPLAMRAFKTRGPRTGAKRWLAERRGSHVTVHIDCGCGRHISTRLATLVGRSQAAIDALPDGQRGAEVFI